ncbi:MAG: Gfo/Idh/MocA family oxidoreductase, partial [Phycisphaerae bacterium]
MDKVKVGLLGTGFIGDIHAAAFAMVPDAEVVAVASPPPGEARAFADERGIPNA